MGRLSEKVAIVTGASKGIGAGIATALGSAGGARGRELFLRPGRRRTRRSGDHPQRLPERKTPCSNLSSSRVDRRQVRLILGKKQQNQQNPARERARTSLRLSGHVIVMVQFYGKFSFGV